MIKLKNKDISKDVFESDEEEKKKKRKKKKKKNHSSDSSNDSHKEGENKQETDIMNNSNDFIIKERYKLIKMLGSGSFGEIHLAYDNVDKCLCSIKFELMNSKNPQLKHEYNILEMLNSPSYNISSLAGIPKVYCFDRIDNKCNYMVMEFLGPSLSDLFNYREKSFSLSTVLLLAIQMLSRLEYVHDNGYIHRDIKPENFLMGLNENSNTLYLIDFGLSKRYKEKGTNNHIQYRENRNLVGTARYASINAHLGIEQSRRDDLESVGYLLVYFMLGKLPWQSKNEKGKDPNKIKEKKLMITPEMLCKKLPVEFSYYFHYIKNLKYQDRPDYTSLKSMFYGLLVSKTQNIKNGHYYFDWFEEIKSDSDSSDSDSSKTNKINNEILEHDDENHTIRDSYTEKENNKSRKHSSGVKNKHIDEKELNILTNISEKKDQKLLDRLKTKIVDKESDNDSDNDTKKFEQSVNEEAIHNILGFSSKIEKEIVKLNNEHNHKTSKLNDSNMKNDKKKYKEDEDTESY